MNKQEKEIGDKLGLKYYFNISNSDYDKRKKALEQSKAIGKIVNIAYDRTGKLTNVEKALYFKDGIEVSKFIYAYNHPKENMIDLSQCTNEELLNEINKRLYKEMLER